MQNQILLCKSLLFIFLKRKSTKKQIMQISIWSLRCLTQRVVVMSILWRKRAKNACAVTVPCLNSSAYVPVPCHLYRYTVRTWYLASWRAVSLFWRSFSSWMTSCCSLRSFSLMLSTRSPPPGSPTSSTRLCAIQNTTQNLDPEAIL